MLAVLALQCFLESVSGRGRGYGAATVVLMGLACLLKGFNLIVLIALCIACLLLAMKTHRARYLAWAGCMVLAAGAASAGLTALYESRAGKALPQGVPKICWVVMGMEENNKELGGAGWYNGHNESIYKKSGFDGGAAKAMAKKRIQERMGEFARDPAGALRFYKEKTITQWAEPTYQGFFLSFDFMAPDKYGGFMRNVYRGGIQWVLVRLMKWYQTAIWLGAALFMLLRGRKGGILTLLPGLVILGGFLFSLIWEAKSQYILPYFLLATPYAAAGFACIIEKIRKALPIGGPH